METLLNKTQTIYERINAIDVVPDFALYQQFIDKMNVGEFTLSKTSITNFAKSPIHFLSYKVGEQKDTAAMEFGSMLHCLILEPIQFFNKYVILEKAKGFESFTWAKGENKDKKAQIQFEAAAESKTVVEMDKLEKALFIKERVLGNSFAGELIKNCIAFEQPVRKTWNDNVWTGYIDGRAQNYIIDLKKVPDADPQRLKWDMYRRKWSWQAFLYLMFSNMSMDCHFYNICYDDAGNVSVIRQSGWDLQLAEAEIMEQVEKLKDCIIGENWFYSFEFNTENGYYNSDEI